eukprot:scaffold28807_cov67-Phaeocystis_antarctica.AAC.18
MCRRQRGNVVPVLAGSDKNGRPGVRRRARTRALQQRVPVRRAVHGAARHEVQRLPQAPTSTLQQANLASAGELAWNQRNPGGNGCAGLQLPIASEESRDYTATHTPHSPETQTRLGGRRAQGGPRRFDLEALVVVQLVLKEELAHFEKGRLREERVGAGVVLGPDALHLQVLGQLVEPALEVLTRLHQVLDVVDLREVELELIEELVLLEGQRPAREHLEQVAEVVARVEGDPLDVVAQHDPRGDEQLRKVNRVDAALLVLRKVEAGALKAGQSVLAGVRAAPPARQGWCGGKQEAGGGALEGEFEVELKGADARGQLALLVTEGEANLDDLQKVDVAAQRLVVKVGRRLEGADGTGDDPRELCVLPTHAWRGSGEG